MKKSTIIFSTLFLFSVYSYCQKPNFDNLRANGADLSQEAAKINSDKNRQNATNINQKIESYYGIEKSKSNFVDEIKKTNQQQKEIEQFKNQIKISDFDVNKVQKLNDDFQLLNFTKKGKRFKIVKFTESINYKFQFLKGKKI